MKIERVNNYQTDEDYFEYKTIHDDGTEGSFDLRITDWDSSHHVNLFVKNDVFNNESRVAEIFFYPHSDSSIKRKGLGTQALNYAVEECKKNNIHLLYAQPTSLEAREFFINNGFKGGSGAHNYLLLNQNIGK